MGSHPFQYPSHHELPPRLPRRQLRGRAEARGAHHAVEHLKKKSSPFLFLDTHAGRGVYDLSEAQPQRSGEYKSGIGRLLDLPAASLPPEVAAYIRLVRESAGKDHSAITAYPGSPVIVARMRRPADRLVLIEKLPKEADAFARRSAVSGSSP